MKKGILYTYNEKTLIGASAKVAKKVKISSKITKITKLAFANCRKLQSIGQLPKVTNIGRAAFWGDGKLSLNLPACAVNVDEYAFAGGQTAAAINVTVDANNPACGIEKWSSD